MICLADSSTLGASVESLGSICLVTDAKVHLLFKASSLMLMKDLGYHLYLCRAKILLSMGLTQHRKLQLCQREREEVRDVRKPPLYLHCKHAAFFAALLSFQFPQPFK